MELTVATYNIQHGRAFSAYLQSGETVSSLAGISELLAREQIDICALNEVICAPEGTKWGDEAARIALPLGYYHAFARAISAYGGDYGNAIVSRYPIRELRTHLLSIPEEARRFDRAKYETRVLLDAIIETPAGALRAMVCHLGLHEDEQQLALERILELAAASSLPTLLMGDCNLTPEHTIYASLAARFTDTATTAEAPLLTFPSHAPRTKIDYIFTNASVRTVWTRTVDSTLSDHRPLLSGIRI